MNRFEELGVEIGRLVASKNKAYGNAFQSSADVLKIYFPDGIPVDKYTTACLITRISDKLQRAATDKDAFGESPFRDISGYGLLGVYHDETKQKDERQKKPLDQPGASVASYAVGLHQFAQDNVPHNQSILDALQLQRSNESQSTATQTQKGYQASHTVDSRSYERNAEGALVPADHRIPSRY